MLAVILAFIMGQPVNAADEKKIGPEEWTQYRLNSQNNPVYNDGEEVELDTTFKTDNQIRSTPVVTGNNIYIGNHESGMIYSYDLHTKELNWKNQAPNWIHSELISSGGKLFVGYGNRFYQKPGLRGTEESGILCLDAESGEILWNFKTDGEVMPTPAIYKDTVYAVTGDEHLYAINPETGKEEWNLELGSIVSMSSPNIHNGILYVGGSDPYHFYAVDLEKQEIKWEKDFEDVKMGLDDVPAVIYNDELVITTALEGDMEKNPEHMIYAMDIKTGEFVWKKSLGKGEMVKNNKSGAPMIYEDQVFVGSPITKKYYALNAGNGEINWKHETAVNKAPPVADNGIVYFVNTKGMVSAFDVKSGDLLGEKELGGKLAPSGPIIINNNLIVGSQDSNVYVVPTSQIKSSSSDEQKSGEKTEGKADEEAAANDTEAADQDVPAGNWIWYLLIILLIGFGIFFFARNRKS
ncbi:hypothetical protein FCL54_19725 [Pseudalkalibacillus caeni]|uniref:Pyrrolo-quinoline quinone repeat domain-containing protein n=2 Tax=Exobacillus caeni TaxID=2574798 RepID=A0A5R9EZH5_9BACL|nr:hypothetical protein FCL54_19725 [Pseudalkalibacillus caeni]